MRDPDDLTRDVPAEPERDGADFYFTEEGCFYGVRPITRPVWRQRLLEVAGVLLAVFYAVLFAYAWQTAK